jgi:hypothetical protein
LITLGCRRFPIYQQQFRGNLDKIIYPKGLGIKQEVIEELRNSKLNFHPEDSAFVLKDVLGKIIISK